MRILLTNLTLATRTGTEVVTRDLALGLAAGGHTPIVFCPDPGPMAEEIRDRGVMVASDLSELVEAPDVIHGHHHVETTTAMLRFPDTPAIFVCHDRSSWHDLPPRCDQVRRYVAVDRNCLERLTQEAGIAVEKTRLIHNAVDIGRFPPPRKVADQPRRALIFSNYAARRTHLEPVMAACSILGLPVDVIGSGVDASSDAPEHVLSGYDIVFAKARCALEAMAAGAAVVLCDSTGLGPMVTLSEVARLRDWNFGRRCLQQRLTPGGLASEILKYDASEAQAVSSWVRAEANLHAAIAAYLELYKEAIEDARQNPVHVTLQTVLRKTAEDCNAAESRLTSAGVRRTVPLPPACIKQIRLRPIEQIRSMDAGSVVGILTEIENASSETLSSHEPYPVRLAYHWIDPASQQVVLHEGHRTALSGDVRSLSKHRQAQLVEAPQRAGLHVLRLTIVQESVCWFETVDAASSADLLIDIHSSGDPKSASALHSAEFDLEQAIQWTDGVTVVRNAGFSNTGFIGSALPRILTFVESRRFARELQMSSTIGAVLTTPELARTVPDHVGLAICDNPRACFVDIHNHLAQSTNFYWKDFPTTIDSSARIHPAAQVAPFNVAVGAGTVIEANAVVGERVIIGEQCTIQAGAILGAEGFQTDRSGKHYREMAHAGGVRLEAGAKVFAGAIIARGVFREFTHIGPEARVGNRAFVSHNVCVGSHVFIGHGAVVNGNVQIGDQAWIGPGANIANNLCIGQNAHVGIGSTVIRNVNSGTRVIGGTAVRSDRMLRFTAKLDKE